MSDAHIIRTLRDRCDLLEEENRQLKEQINGLRDESIVPLALRLTSRESAILTALLRKPGVASLEYLFVQSASQAAYRYNHVQVYLHKIRTKLRPHGMSIETVWGLGVRLPRETRECLAAMLEQERAAS